MGRMHVQAGTARESDALRGTIAAIAPGDLRPVAQLMRTDVPTAQRDQPLRQAWSALHSRGTRWLPVLDGHRLEGVLLLGDIETLRAVEELCNGADDHWVDVLGAEDLMRTPVPTLPPHAPVRRALALLQRSREGCVVIVERGRYLGLLTADDCLPQ